MTLTTFRSDCEKRDPLNEHAVVCTTRTAENVDAVGDLVQSQENQPQTQRSTGQISRELGIPQTNNWRRLFLFSFAMNVNEHIIIAFKLKSVVI